MNVWCGDEGESPRRSKSVDRRERCRHVVRGVRTSGRESVRSEWVQIHWNWFLGLSNLNSHYSISARFSIQIRKARSANTARKGWTGLLSSCWGVFYRKWFLLRNVLNWNNRTYSESLVTGPTVSNEPTLRQWPWSNDSMGGSDSGEKSPQKEKPSSFMRKAKEVFPMKRKSNFVYTNVIV